MSNATNTPALFASVRTSADLEAMPAESFLRPENFLVGAEKVVNDMSAAFLRGMIVSRDATEVTVGVNNVWGATMKNGAACHSYEKLGYHAQTASFWAGILSSGCCAIVVYRRNAEGKVERHEIRRHTAEVESERKYLASHGPLNTGGDF